MPKLDCTPKVEGILSRIFESSPAHLVAQFTSQELALRAQTAMSHPEVSGLGGSAAVKRASELLFSDIEEEYHRTVLVADQIGRTKEESVADIRDNYGEDSVEGFRSLLFGGHNKSENSRMSSGQAKNTEVMNNITTLITALESVEGTERLKSGVYDENLIEISRSIGDDSDLSSFEGKDVAIASIIRRHAGVRRLKANSFGAKIGELAGRLFRQYHDPSHVRNANKRLSNTIHAKVGDSANESAWLSFQLENLDHKMTFPKHVVSVQDKKAWLRPIFKHIIEGGDDVYTSHDPTKRKGTLLPAKSISEDRVLHYTAAGEFNNMKTFGHGTVFKSIGSELHLMGNRTGLLSTLGLNPHATLTSIADGLLASSTSPAETRKLKKYIGNFANGDFGKGLGWDYLEVTGANNRIVSDMGSTLATIAMFHNNWTELGRATLSSVVDTANSSMELQYQRGNHTFFSSFGETVGNAFRGMASSSHRNAAHSAGIGLDNAFGAQFSFMGSLDSPLGAISSLNNAYFKVNLLTPFTNAMRIGHYTSQAHYLSKVIADPSLLRKGELKSTLASYGISEQTLAFLRDKSVEVTSKGETYFNSPAIHKIPLKEFIPLPSEIARIDSSLKKFAESSRPEIRRKMVSAVQAKMRNDLHDRFLSFFLDRNDFAVLNPKGRVTSLVNRGRGKGDPVRILSSLFFQYKQFALAMFDMPMRRTFNSNTANVSMISHLTLLIGMGAVAGFLTDIAKGNPMRTPGDTPDQLTEFWMKAFLRSGAGGLWGDLMFGGMQNAGRNALYMGGPTVGKLLEFKDFSREAILNVARNDTIGPEGSPMWALMKNNIPLQNVFYLKIITDAALKSSMLDPENIEMLTSLGKRDFGETK